ncbi:MAG: cytochrome ubiquinol oxidase subunit I, partial [Bacteroidaceae bacterium]|nr:cytochrome ubiquinol oxidase subunit I [Bacteroidaceae bacterium]
MGIRARTQPMKLAAMEGLYKGGTDQALTVVAGIRPFRQPDYETEDEAPLRVGIPYALSFLATRDMHGYVPGVRDMLDGYTKADGTAEPSLDEKIERGKCAVTALQEYRKAKKEGAPEAFLATLNKEIQDNIPYLGYSYVSERAQVVPYIPVCFYAFRIMVGGGCLFVLLFVVVLWPCRKKGEEQDGKQKSLAANWKWIFALLCIPMAYIVSECGWLVTEFGRQPWTIQDQLPTWVGVSRLGSPAVMTTFFLFLVLFTALLAVEISIMCKAIKKGPEL